MATVRTTDSAHDLGVVVDSLTYVTRGQTNGGTDIITANAALKKLSKKYIIHYCT